MIITYSDAVPCVCLTCSNQFIDMCILLGCDYCDAIKGIGPMRAVSLIRDHGCIENILKTLDSKKYPVPEDWPYKEARELFKNPEVHDPTNVDVRDRNSYLSISFRGLKLCNS
jgi:5'-3' exonuclease